MRFSRFDGGIRTKYSKMQRPYLIGAGVRSDDIATFNTLSGMYDAGTIDHIQLMVIPEKHHTFKKRLETITTSNARIFLHAPHHGQGVNPCAPAAFDQRERAEIDKWIEDAMALTFEAADILGTPIIVLHAGRYEDGKKEEAFHCIREFLREYGDPRLILENLPEVYAGYHLLGSTAEELARIGTGLVNGYCLDFAHLYCTTNYLKLDYNNELEGFEKLPVRLHHLSNSERGSIKDQHLELDHPNGGLDFATVIGYIRRHPGVHTSLEYKNNNAEIYYEQLEVFDRIYHRYD
jgi:endonuclease IV